MMRGYLASSAGCALPQLHTLLRARQRASEVDPPPLGAGPPGPLSGALARPSVL